jgi:hypothetical protein
VRRLEKNLFDLEDAAAVHIDRLGRATRDLVSQAEAVRGKRPARRARGATSERTAPAAPARVAERGDPPASNRGVKSVGRGTRKTAKRGAR